MNEQSAEALESESDPRRIRLQAMGFALALGMSVIAHGMGTSCDLGPDARVNQLTGQLPKLFRQTDLVQEMLPKGNFEIAARQALIGSDADRLFAWVRDETAALPYDGVLKGSRGTLMDRAGSSIDRALLLADLLQSAGHESRLAFGPVDEHARVQLMDAIAHRLPDLTLSDGEGTQYLAADQELLSALELLPADIEPQLDADVSRSRAWAARALDKADRQAAMLRSELDQRSPEGVSSWRPATHWWVQLRVGNEWRDLDPGAPDLRPGQRAVREIRGTLWPEELDDAEFHRLTITVLAERHRRQGIDELTALEHTLRVADLHGHHLRLDLVPLGLPDLTSVFGHYSEMLDLKDRLLAVEGWVPVLGVSGERQISKAIMRDGSVSDRFRQPATARGAGEAAGLLGGLSVSGGLSSTREVSELGAVFVEYRVSAPGREDESFRRAMADPLGQDGSPDRQLTLAWDESDQLARAVGMMSSVELLPQTNWWPASFGAGYALYGLQQNRVVLLAAIQAWQHGDQALLARALEEIDLASTSLSSLALLRRSVSRFPNRLAITRVNLLSEFEQMRLVQGRPRNRVGIDILDNRVEVLGGAGEAAAMRLHQGVLDTVLEALILEDHLEPLQVANAALAFEHDLESGQEWIRLDPLNPSSQASVSIPPAAQAALQAGWRVIVQPIDPSIDRRLDRQINEQLWWRLDPKSGDLLGMGPSGRGQSITEAILIELEGMNNAASAVQMVQTIMACVLDSQNAQDPSAGASQALCCTAMAGAQYGFGKVTSKATGALAQSYARSLELSKVYEAALSHIFGTYVGWAQEAVGYMTENPCES